MRCAANGFLMDLTDRMLAGNLIATLAAVFDVAVAAQEATSLVAAEHCRKVGTANLQVAARLLQSLGYGSRLALGPAAGVPEVNAAGP